jgi:RHS repeat-associated protein
MGSLMQDGQDASGLMFRRNRYYDPASGRFTQEDPIGLAGGVNAYGFTGGDPVSYNDPYGLGPCNVILHFTECRAQRLLADMASIGHPITITEARYYVNHPFVMYHALISVTGATIFSERMAARYPQREGVLNAARHQFGQCMMTRATDEQTAATTADLHEAERPSNDADSRIDQANNRKGRAAGRNSSVDCQTAVEQNILAGNVDWDSQAAAQFTNPLQ